MKFDALTGFCLDVQIIGVQAPLFDAFLIILLRVPFMSEALHSKYLIILYSSTDSTVFRFFSVVPSHR